MRKINLKNKFEIIALILLLILIIEYVFALIFIPYCIYSAERKMSQMKKAYSEISEYEPTPPYTIVSGSVGVISNIINTVNTETPTMTTIATELPVTTAPAAEPVIAEPTWQSLGTFKITAYCNCETCCGKWAGSYTTTTGTTTVQGRTVAVDPNTISFGSEIMVGETSGYIAEDKPAGWVIEKTGGRIIDLYFDSHQDALNFGEQWLEVKIKM